MSTSPQAVQDTVCFSPFLTDDDIKITSAAQQKLLEILGGAGEQQEAVRIFVSGGGCSGMTYGMTFAEDATNTDSVLTTENGLKVVVDPVALSYLSNAEIDYIDDGMNTSFVFNNVFQAVGGSGACGGCGGACG